jgi:peptide/nickel transport system ATP-binding protein
VTSGGRLRPEHRGRLLEVRDLQTHFATPKGRVRAVDGVSLDLERGAALGVVGESGSGKTVLARSIMGLLPRKGVFHSGSVIFEGTDLSKVPPKELRSFWGTEMSMIFQDPMTSLNPLMKIGKQIAEPLRVHLGIDKDGARSVALRLLKDVGIPEPEKRLEQYPHEMSGGMRQRAMIAVALACGPKLLFADEPTTALDVTVQAQILDLIQVQRQDRNMSVVLVTHDLGVVAGHTDHIVVMYAGKIVEKAPTSVLFSDMKHPYSEALMRSIPSVDQPSHTRLIAIGGRPPDLVNPPPGCRFAPRCPYADDTCRREEPPLVQASTSDHVFACWHPVGSSTWAAKQQALVTAQDAVG